MDPGEHGMHMVEAPIVTPADPFDPESRTADLTRPGWARPRAAGPADPLVPAADVGPRGWAAAA
ncbi:MAG TPA: hypothetical protein VGB74_07200, partial [Actinoplanes sp.]